ncbi:glycosyl transferase family 90-domain-containing protein [Hyaloscypha finlandica]|nr:glycosyl transferase family 90-domain-containing protein [Hyaloscypha finlandica]
MTAPRRRFFVLVACFIFETLKNLSLTEEQCRATFPGLMMEFDGAVARGPFKLEKEPDDYTGMVQLRIKDGKMYIITTEHRPNRDMGFERNAVLHQLHRALITSPTPLPNTIITLSILDTPHTNALSFARSNDPQIPALYWLMPHFSFWAWPLPFIGTLDSALARISAVETSTPWSKKIDKVVWRGTTWFNSVGNTNLRPKLLQLTKGKEWADVEDLKWFNNGEKARNSLLIEDFCKYKYIIYTEGITYSGRLPFHQSCRSIILTPPLTYLMHTTHLLRPLFSSTLPLSTSPYSLPFTHQPVPNSRWPKSYPPSQANIIFISPDCNSAIAEGIAERQREVVKEGYLSEASEVCYWRSLLRGWSSVARVDEEEWGSWDDEGRDVRGVRWEEFSLTQKAWD